MPGPTVTYRAVANFSAALRQARQMQSQLQQLNRAQSGTSARGSAVGLRTVGVAAGTASQKLAQAQRATDKYSRSAGEASFASHRLTTAVANMSGRMGPAAAATGQLAASLAGVGSGGAAAAAVITAITAASAALGLQFLSQQEQSEIAFTSILKDAAAADDLMQRIIRTAAVTPFETQGLTQIVRQLLAYGFQVDEVLQGAGNTASGLVITIGNAVAAMGGSQDILNRVAVAIGQIRTQGKATAQDLRQLAQAGLPVYEILRQKLQLTGKEVANIGRQGITADRTIQALAEGLNERFGGAMVAQSKTLLGVLSTVKDNIRIGLSQAFLGSFAIAKDTLLGIGNFLSDLTARSEEVGFMQALSEQAPIVASVLQSILNVLSAVRNVLIAVAPSARAFMEALGGPALFILVNGLNALASAINTVAGWFKALPGPVKVAIGALVAFTVAMRVLLTTIELRRMQAFIALLPGMRTGLVAVTLVAQGLTQALRNVAAGQGVAGIKNALSGLPGLLSGITGPQAAVVVGMAAIATTALLVKRNIDKMKAAHDSANEAADRLIKTQKLEVASFNEVADAANKAGDAVGNKFASDNANAIEQLQKFKDTADSDAYLINIGYSLVEKGVTAEDAFAQVSRLAEAAGVQLPVRFDAESIGSMEERLKALGVTAAQVTRETSDNAGHIGTKTKEVITGIAKDIGLLMAIPGQEEEAIRQMAAFDTALRETAGSTAEANALINYFTDEVLKNDTAIHQSSSSVRGFTGYLKELSTSADGVTQEQKDMAKEILFWTDQGVPISDAVDKVAQKYDDLAEAQREEAKAAQEAIDVSEAQAEALKVIEDRIEDVQKSFADFTQPMEVFGSVFDEVGDKQKEAAENAAINAGLGADSWQMFTEDAGLSLQDFADALEAQIIAQEEWGVNLAKVAELYGPAIAEQLREMGPEAAGIVKQMVDDSSGEGQRLADLLAKDAKNGSNEVAAEWQRGMDLLAKIIENPEINPQALADAIAAPLEGLTTLAAAYGADAGRAWMNRFESTLRNAQPGIDPRSQAGRLNPTPHRYGAIYQRFANGGQRLPRQAVIQNETPDLVQWAEPGTGGEAFIPLGSGNRERSLSIWQKVGQALGAFPKMAFGGIFGRTDRSGDRRTVLGERRRARIDRNAEPEEDATATRANNDALKEQQELEEDIAKNAAKFAYDRLSRGRQIAENNRKLLELEEQGLAFSDEWIDAFNARKDLEDDIWQEREAANEALTDMLEKEADARQDLVQAQRDAQRESVDISNDYLDSIAEAQEEFQERSQDENRAYNEALADENESYFKARQDIAKREAEAIADTEKRYKDALKQRADSFSGALDPMEEFTRGWANSADAIIRNLDDQNRAFTEWSDGLAELQSRGVSQGVIEALGLDDPTALAQVQALLNSTPDQLAAINAQIASRQAVTAGAADRFSPEAVADRAQGIADAQAEAAEAYAELDAEHAARLQQLQSDHNEAMADLSSRLAETLADSYDQYRENADKIRADLADRTAEINAELASIGPDLGTQVEENIRKGLDSSIPAIRAFAAQLRAAMADPGTSDIPIPAHHTGGVVTSRTGAKEVLRRLETGEGIISTDGMKRLVDSMNAGKSSFQDPADIFSQAMGADSSITIPVYLDGKVIAQVVSTHQKAQNRVRAIHKGGN